jgi:hypothetical protein
MGEAELEQMLRQQGRTEVKRTTIRAMRYNARGFAKELKAKGHLRGLELD